MTKEKRIKKSVDFTVKDIEIIKEFKQEYLEKTGAVRLSNSAVLGMLLSTFGKLSSDTRQIIAECCKQNTYEIIGKCNPKDQFTYKETQRVINELQNIMFYMTYGKEVDLNKSGMKTIKINTGYAEVPDEWIELKLFEPSEADSVYVLEFRNGDKYGYPHFVFGAKGTPDYFRDLVFREISKVDPKFKQALFENKTDAYSSSNREDAYESAPIPGFFKIADADDNIPDTEYPYGAKFFRSGDEKQ